MQVGPPSSMPSDDAAPSALRTCLHSHIQEALGTACPLTGRSPSGAQLYHETARDTCHFAHSPNPHLLGSPCGPDAGATAVGKTQPLFSGLSQSRGTDVPAGDDSAGGRCWNSSALTLRDEQVATHPSLRNVSQRTGGRDFSPQPKS